MKRIILIATLISVSFFGLSQKPKFEDNDPKAKVILDKLSVKHKKIDNIVIEFSAVFSGAKIKKQTIKGTAFKSGKKYAYFTPEYTVINNGKDNWLYVKDDNEVTITSNEDASEENGLMSPSKLLSIWEKGFKYKYVGEKTVKGKKIQEVRLYPTDIKKSKFHTITLFIDKEKNELVKVLIKGRDGVNITYNITKFKHTQKIPASKFIFDKSKYPNCTVNDQRF